MNKNSVRTLVRDPLALVFIATVLGSFYFAVAETFPGSRDDALILIGCTIGFFCSAVISGVALAARSLMKKQQPIQPDSNTV